MSDIDAADVFIKKHLKKGNIPVNNRILIDDRRNKSKA